jgi:hypothetical protein
MLVEAVSECRGSAPFAILGRVSGFEPFTTYAHTFSSLIGLGFTTDGDGAAIFDLLEDEERPSVVSIAIWPDPNGNLMQDPGEPTVFSGTFVNDRPCTEGVFVPD